MNLHNTPHQLLIHSRYVLFEDGQIHVTVITCLEFQKIEHGIEFGQLFLSSGSGKRVEV